MFDLESIHRKLSFHPAYKFAKNSFIAAVLVDCYASENTKLYKVMSYSRAKSHALSQYNVHGFPIMLRQLRALLTRGGMLSLLIYRLMRFKGECRVRNGHHHARCVILRQNFQATKTRAETLFQRGMNLYKQKRFSKAAMRWGQAALLHHGLSHAFLSNMLLEGRQNVPKDKKRAFELASAGTALGCAHSKGVLACCLVSGHGVKREKVRGLAIGRESAATGSSFGQNCVGKCYTYGYGVQPDDVEATRWFKLAARQGHAVAQYCLGSKFAKGDGVEHDDVEAVRWWRLAAAQGYDVAQFSLGWMLRKGKGVIQDYTEAARWFRLAAAQGLETAQDELESMVRYGLI